MTSPGSTPRLDIPSGYQCTVRLVHAGQPAVVVLGGKGAGGWTDQAGAAAWRDAFWTAFRTGLNDVQCVGATVRRVDGSGAIWDVGAPANSASAGTGTGHAVAAASYLIKWNTAQAGRSGKGRTFLPGVYETEVNNDGRTWSGAASTAIQTSIDAYLADMAGNGAGMAPAVLSFRKGAAYEITGGSLAPIVGIQRRRMRA